MTKNEAKIWMNELHNWNTLLPEAKEACRIAEQALEDIKKIERYTKLFEQTMEWGCNDRAKFLYANAIYSVISKNETFKECEDDFLEYMYENRIG